jgi:hypothetical protein
MAIKCPQCGAEYDVPLFTFGRGLRCDCGAEHSENQVFNVRCPRVCTANRPRERECLWQIVDLDWRRNVSSATGIDAKPIGPMTNLAT